MVLTVLLTVSTVIAITVSVTLRFYQEAEIAERRRYKPRLGNRPRPLLKATIFLPLAQAHLYYGSSGARCPVS